MFTSNIFENALLMTLLIIIIAICFYSLKELFFTESKLEEKKVLIKKNKLNSLFNKEKWNL